ncbi:MAG: hypothetical protein GX349_00775 [Firmicutes bacterium]|nr:hypothetical protein [Bacillota bacterium]
MNIKGFRLHIIIAVALISILLFFAGKYCYQRYLVLEPLLKQVRAIEGVRDVQVSSLGGGRLFLVSLGDVEDLVDIYGKIDGQLAEVFEEQSYALHLLDARNEKLEEVYHSIHFAIYEAIDRGNFTHLADVVAKQALANGMGKYRVTVDGERVYLQLHLGEAYLYEIVPRGEPGKGGG